MSLTVRQLREALQLLEERGLGDVETTAEACTFHPAQQVPAKTRAWGTATVTTPANGYPAYVDMECGCHPSVPLVQLDQA
jgi:hypothetical protein